MIYIVYITTNKITGHVYIGVHKQEEPYKFDGYFGSGVWRGSKRLGWKKSISEAIKDYGKENFERETLFYYWDEDEAYRKEAEIVNEEFVKADWNYNLIPGGTKPPRRFGSDHYQYGKPNHKLVERNKNNNPMKDENIRQKSIQNQCEYWTTHKHPQKGIKKPYLTELNLKNNPAKRPGVAEKISKAMKGKPSPKKGKKTGKPAWNKGLKGTIASGTRFINNNIVSKRIPKDQPLPDGWYEHRLPYHK